MASSPVGCAEWVGSDPCSTGASTPPATADAVATRGRGCRACWRRGRRLWAGRAIRRWCRPRPERRRVRPARGSRRPLRVVSIARASPRGESIEAFDLHAPGSRADRRAGWPRWGRWSCDGRLGGPTAPARTDGLAWAGFIVAAAITPPRTAGRDIEAMVPTCVVMPPVATIAAVPVSFVTPQRRTPEVPDVKSSALVVRGPVVAVNILRTGQ